MMGLMFGYNPPPSSISAASIAFLVTKAGNTNSAYAKAAEQTNGGGGSLYYVLGGFPVPPALSPRSKFRITADIANSGGVAVSYLNVYGIPSSLGVALGSYLSAAQIACSITLTSISTTQAAYKTYTADFSEPLNGAGYVVIVGYNANVQTQSVKNITIKYDNDTTEKLTNPFSGSS